MASRSFLQLQRKTVAVVTPTIARGMASVPPPRLFDYATIKKNLPPSKAMVDAIENAFGMLAKDKVDVPLPMHIGKFCNFFVTRRYCSPVCLNFVIDIVFFRFMTLL